MPPTLRLQRAFGPAIATQAYAITLTGMLRLSVIVPVFDEVATIVETLTRLAPLRARGAEVIVVDGGSLDGTVERARPLADHVIAAPRGRGAQMNAGAAIARGEVLMFLHADTRLPPDADRLIGDALARSGRAWGRFDVAIAGRSPLLPLVARAMNLRSRLSGIATGDQAMFATRAAFDRVNGFPDIALMEDIVLSRRLKRISPPVCLVPPVVTSGRRWDERGALRTIWLMWRLRLAFFFGAAPDALARQYGYVPREP
jgi:rSAM/selenodomain-associated transferase 2